MEVVKRPRGRPPLPETLRRRLKQQQQQQRSRSAAEPVKPPPSSATTNTTEPRTTNANSAPNPPAHRSPEQPPEVVKKRRKQGPRGMARLFVNRPGSKISVSAKPSLKSPSSTAEFSPPKDQVLDDSLPESSNVGKPSQAVERCEQPMEPTTEQMIPRLSSPIWHPASKRVLDAVCVTDVTACSGVTVTVRESSVVDGFFRSRPDEP